MFSAVSDQWDQQFSTACLSLKIMLVTSLVVVLSDKNCRATAVDLTHTSSRQAEHISKNGRPRSLPEKRGFLRWALVDLNLATQNFAASL